jgi:hypothetical protein
VADGRKRTTIPTQPVECRRCREVKIVPGAVSVGDMSRASGFSPVLRSDTSILWFCPKCVASLRPHIQAIVDATLGEHIYWPHMIDLLKDAPVGSGT